MAFYLPLPQVCVKLEKHFILNGVHTYDSLRNKRTTKDVKDEFKQNIKDAIKDISNNLFPDPKKTYIICVRMTCCTGRNFPNADNVAKPIIEEIFGKNHGSIDIVQGIQAEGEIIDTGNEQTEVYIYSIRCQRQNS